MKFAFAPVLYYLASSPPSSNTIIHSNKMPTPNDRLPTLREFTLPSEDSPRNKNLSARTNEMNQLFEKGAPLSEKELDDILNSIQNLCPKDNNKDFTIDLDDLKKTLTEIAHISHKDWNVTGKNTKLLEQKLFPEGVATPMARQILERILTEGNWDGAAQHAQDGRPDSVRPWAVLVTGVNGIRKTTSIYQDWFPQILKEALVPPKDMEQVPDFPKESLPVGSNSFFRQLDHMIATLCNEDFKVLYWLTEKELEDNGNTPENPSSHIVKKYSDLKAAIFSRYRTLSELLGALLLREAQTLKSNCMMETSGRDVAMFHYVDHFFPADKYNKLALHFNINDLSQAQTSVDQRMIGEIQTGIQALQAKDVFDVVYANAGGPYGSEVLPGVQEASDRVWKDVVMKGDQVGQDWYKATININAYSNKPWTAQAVRADGSLGPSVFAFENKK